MTRARPWRRLAWLGIACGIAALVHALATRALVDHGVAGALLAGGGGWSTVAAAALLLAFRVACAVALAAVPAIVVWWMIRAEGSDAKVNRRH